MVQYPPSPSQWHVQKEKKQWYAHMCVQVYHTYAYILLGSISAVYFICAIILAHTHMQVFIIIWMKKTNGNMHLYAFSWPVWKHATIDKFKLLSF